ncbi:hypothetical protein [Mycolicibacterium houstonense]|uniref:hypothetical protein n=1 Tax=Mycolicibacterium houstonense TaxID=146021 RepID=UPI00135A7D50|nr:hypothetical protein [Mycolicibacterium houstonense]
MRDQLARMLRQAANKLDPPKSKGQALRYSGQTAALGVEGLMETFVAPRLGVNFVQPWALRVAEGLAGARPALPNMAPSKPSLWRRILNWFRR